MSFHQGNSGKSLTGFLVLSTVNASGAEAIGVLSWNMQPAPAVASNKIIRRLMRGMGL